MVKAVVLYGPPEDPGAFERYYADTHTALAKASPGHQALECRRESPRRRPWPRPRCGTLVELWSEGREAG